jgi:fumarate hydratase subunit alpha
MREIKASDITSAIKEMCTEANRSLSPDMKRALYNAAENEESPLGRQILGQLKENLSIAASEDIPICQDTGMAVVFLEIGQDVHFTGGSLVDAVNRGVALGYEEGYLRKSVVKDPLIRISTEKWKAIFTEE